MNCEKEIEILKSRIFELETENRKLKGSIEIMQTFIKRYLPL
jgi:hypothetical protein